MSQSLDVYRRSTDAKRDVTRWIATVVPVAALAAALVEFVPDLARVPTSGLLLPAVLFIALIVVLATLIGLAVWVQTGWTEGWGEMQKTLADESVPGKQERGVPKEGSLLAEVDREGLLPIFGFQNMPLFFEALGEMDKPDYERTVGAATTMLDFGLS